MPLASEVAVVAREEHLPDEGKTRPALRAG